MAGSYGSTNYVLWVQNENENFRRKQLVLRIITACLLCAVIVYNLKVQFKAPFPERKTVGRNFL